MAVTYAQFEWQYHHKYNPKNQTEEGLW
jgi:hypothetical protein